jgi:hypothetical protein
LYWKRRTKTHDTLNGYLNGNFRMNLRRTTAVRFRLSQNRWKRRSTWHSSSIPKGKSLEEIASFPIPTPEEIAQKAPEREPEPTPGELFDGNIGKLGRVVHDVPFDGNGG